MSVQHANVHPIVRKLASATCAVALLPIGMGALVTTLKSGMAFADWPSSDGHNMLLYPWFRDFASNTDKFTEHGHRLGGMLIGIVSIGLAIAGWKYGQRWVRAFVTAILVSVILQGLLGGARVLFDRQHLALVHSITGASFFSLCVLFRVLCSPRWSQWLAVRENRIGPLSAATIVIAPVIVLGQYFLGGLLRHLHVMLNEHLMGAVVAGVVSLAASVFLLRANHTLLKSGGIAVAATLFSQLFLGAGSYLTRFGFPMLGYVATSGSVSQAVVCSLHTVCGMFLLASTSIGALSVVQLHRAGCLDGLRVDVSLLSRRESAI